jgi:predicted hydrocarbon binding protein
VDLNAIGGVLEALCNKKCVGEEKTIRGKRYFIYEIHPKKEEVEYPITILDAEEYDKLVDKLVDHIVNKKPSGRVKLEDNYHISCEQAAVYFITKISEGHRILEKHSGVKCGRKISKQADIKRLDKSLEYAQQLFQYTKAGILHKPERRDDRITIKMTESAYSSGVNNINMKLDLFLAGMIEGLLKESTGGDWQVDETKCLANGDDYCEFTCKPR